MHTEPAIHKWSFSPPNLIELGAILKLRPQNFQCLGPLWLFHSRNIRFCAKFPPSSVRTSFKFGPLHVLRSARQKECVHWCHWYVRQNRNYCNLHTYTNTFISALFNQQLTNEETPLESAPSHPCFAHEHTQIIRPSFQMFILSPQNSLRLTPQRSTR